MAPAVYELAEQAQQEAAAHVTRRLAAPVQSRQLPSPYPDEQGATTVTVAPASPPGNE